MDWFKLFYTLLGGLGIFFFGMKMMSENLQAVASQWIQSAINALTSNRFVAVLVGLSITCFVQSSSITTVMVIGFVNAGLMQLSQAIGVILGANIGTTITGWIISIKVGEYALLFVGLSVFPALFSKNEKVTHYAKIVFALGMIFLGLNLMSSAFKPLRSHSSFLEVMTFFSAEDYTSLVMTIMVGCLLTFVVQSSSAMLAITIALATTGAITFQTALALVLGENIGTTVTALLAGIGANTQAKRASYAHAIFNVLGVIVVSSFFWFYMGVIDSIMLGSADFISSSGDKPYIASHIAAGHTIFNVINVFLFLPFIKILEKLICKLAPDKGVKEPKTLEFFGDPRLISPALGIPQALAELVKMSNIVENIFSKTRTYLNKPQDRDLLAKEVRRKEDITDRIHIEMAVFLGHVMEAPLSNEDTQKIKSILRMTDELESIADYCASIVKSAERAYKDNIVFDEKTQNDIEALADRTAELFDTVHDCIVSYGKIDIESLKPQWEAFNSMLESVKDSHLQHLTEKNITPMASLTLSDIVVSFRRIKNHTVNLAEAYHGGKDSSLN